MQGLEPLPQANYVPVSVMPVAPGETSLAVPGQAVGALVSAPTKTDGFAVASAICGFTAIIPLVSQLIGLACGTLALWRIRRARRFGVQRGGTRWAVAGIVSSGFALLGWIGMFFLLYGVRDSLSHSVNSIGSLAGIAQ